MAVQCDFNFARQEDGVLTVSMRPPTSVAGWTIEFNLMKRFGGEAILTKSAASGYNGTSGISIVNLNQGIFNVQIDSIDTSGLAWNNYAYQTLRTNPGSRTELTEGFMVLTP